MNAHPELDALHASHLATVSERTEKALSASGFDALLVHSGIEHLAFLDDQTFPYRPNPHFTWWVPRTDAPHSLLHIEPGRKPLLLFHAPQDYWHKPPSLPEGAWTTHFELIPVRDWKEMVAALPAPAGRTAFIGEATPETAALGGIETNPETLLRWLHEQRVRKTSYEIACQREASRKAAAGHVAARAAHKAGESELGIHQAFLAACGQRESDLPYRPIIARGANGATLHYQSLDAARPGRPTSLLIDAGASYRGYGSDITRSWAANPGDEFDALVQGMEELQQSLCGTVREGTHWPDLHLLAHHKVAGLLQDAGVLRIAAEDAVESGLSGTFLPHGLGHLLGLQVHDVGGFHPAPDAPPLPPPAGHPALRLTRRLEQGMVVTMEPGIYFIDMLLDAARRGPLAPHVDWDVVDRLKQHGGIRIEDNLVVGRTGCENLTRDAFLAAGS
ncbi:MAG: Xaa-Pro dipeptidase [Pseudomonadota bacterium]